MKKKLWCIIFTVTLAVAALNGCGKVYSTETDVKGSVQEKELSEKKETQVQRNADVVRIGFVSTDGSGIMSDPVGYARDNGYTDEELGKIGVKAEWYPIKGAGPAINEALASGDLDIGKLGDIPGIIGKANGIDTKVISLGSTLNTADILVSADSPIKSVADLKGKKIATGKGQFMHVVLAQALEEEGLTLNDIEFINIFGAESVSALLSGDVDAICISGEPEANLLLSGDARIVGGSRINENNYTLGFIEARTEFAEENPDIIKAFLRAILRAEKEYAEDSSLVRTQWTNSDKSGETYDLLYKNGGYTFPIRITDESKEKTETTIQFLKDNELIDQAAEINMNEWFDSSYYEAVISEEE